MCSRSVWNLENALFTVWTAAAAACAWSEQAFGDADADGEADGEEEGDALGEAVAVAVGLAVAVAVGLTEADGLALACVMVIVVTPFCTVAVTSAPVVPMRNTPAMTPVFAWSNSSSRRSNIPESLLVSCGERGRRRVC
jgi:hypothetical protein